MNQFKNEIYGKFKQKYEQITKDSFEKFYEMVASELDVAENKNSSIKYLLVKTIRPTKKRWIKIIVNDKENSFNMEIESARIQYEKVQCGEMPISKFKDFFGVTDIDEYKTNHLKVLNKWALDDNLFLTDFKYLEDLKNKSILSAFKNDIYLFYLLCSQKQEMMISENANITKVPRILSELPIDTSGKIYYLSDAQKNNLDQVYDTDTDVGDTMPTLDKLISLEGDEKEEILMRLEKKTYLEIKKGGNPDKFLDMMTQIALLKSIKYLNSFDTKIINYYYNHFEHVLTGTPIDKTLYEIIKDLNMPNTKIYYEYVENSLAKIGSINMTYNIEGNKLYGNLLSCMIYTENNIKKAKVYLGAILQNLVLKDGAFEYDKDVYNKLSVTSQQLAVWLQKRRYSSAIKKGGCTDSISVKTFSNAIYFNTKRADRKRKKIVESLEELKANGLIIENYNYDKKIDNIVITYMPLTMKETKKLGLLNNDKIIDSSNCIKEQDNIEYIE